MGKVLDAVDDSIAEFIAAQKMFFVATAPLAADGSEDELGDTRDR